MMAYRRVRIGATRVVALPEVVSWAETVLGGGTGRGQTLHRWAATLPGSRSFSGRGQVHSVEAPVAGPDGRARWAIRHYHRGGAVAALLQDRYLRLGRTRPERELAASTAARARGVATPAVVAGAVYPAGIYYRCDLVTEVVPDARTLAEVAHTTHGTPAWSDAMASAGRLTITLADAGILHVDLNAHNILFEGGALAKAWVVDLDRARVLSGGASAAAHRMLARLARSVVKTGVTKTTTSTGGPLPLRPDDVVRALKGAVS